MPQGEVLGQGLLDSQSRNWPIWPALVVVAGLLLVVETLYVTRLCPRSNPKAVATVAVQRGIAQAGLVHAD